jgi:hypothetical protein
MVEIQDRWEKTVQPRAGSEEEPRDGRPLVAGRFFQMDPLIRYVSSSPQSSPLPPTLHIGFRAGRNGELDL